MKKKRIVLIVLLLLIAAAALFLLTDGMGREKIPELPADVYLNGRLLDERGVLYWYGGQAHQGAANAALPLIPVLKGLGCTVEGDGQGENATLLIRAGDRSFELRIWGYNGSLYENGTLVASSAASRERFRGGVLYLDGRDCASVLAALGFPQNDCEIDDEAMTIRLTALPG